MFLFGKTVLEKDMLEEQSSRMVLGKDMSEEKSCK